VWRKCYAAAGARQGCSRKFGTGGFDPRPTTALNFPVENGPQIALARKGQGEFADATMETKTKACNPDAATGFIRLNAPRLKVAAKGQRKI
jgi:hypothetical protein